MSASTEPVTERKAPLALIAAGVALILLRTGLILKPTSTVSVLSALAIVTAVGVGMMLVACYLTAFLLKISFGELKSAALKLAAIFLFPHAVGAFLPMGGIIAAFIALGLVIWLFELELAYAIAFAVIVWATEMVVAAVLLAVLG